MKRRIADLERVIQRTIQRLDSIGPCYQTESVCQAKVSVMNLAKALRTEVATPGSFVASKLKAPVARVSLCSSAKPSRDLTEEESGHLTKLVYDLEEVTMLEPEHEDDGRNVTAVWDPSSPLRSITAGRGIVTVVIEDRVLWKFDTTGVEAYVRYCLRQEIVSAYSPWKH